MKGVGKSNISYQSIFDDRPATVNLSDDGLPNFGSDSGLQQFKQTVQANSWAKGLRQWRRWVF